MSQSYPRGGSYEKGAAGPGRESDVLRLSLRDLTLLFHGTLPFDVDTGELIPEVWDRWLAWDPVRMVPSYADSLRGLRAIYIDAGTRDQWFLDLGARAMVRALERIGVTDVYFELFDATHTAIDYRYPTGLGYLAERLSP